MVAPLSIMPSFREAAGSARHADLKNKGMKMFLYDRPLFRSLRGPVLAGGVLLTCLVPPALASGREAGPSGQAVAAAHRKEDADPTEERIRDLHDKLQISEAQAGQWEAVARVMRGNAKTIEALIEDKRKNEQTMTALEDLRAYQDISEAHAKAAKKLADVFEVLYETMTEDQKKLADVVFRQHKRNTVK